MEGRGYNSEPKFTENKFEFKSKFSLLFEEILKGKKWIMERPVLMRLKEFLFTLTGISANSPLEWLKFSLCKT